MDERGPLVDVMDDTAAGVRGGITSTPTVEVNGERFLGVPDIAEFLAAVDAAAAGASPVPLPTPRADDGRLVRRSTPDGRTAGRADAPVTVELWMDYQSADSAAIARALEPELRTRIAAGDSPRRGSRRGCARRRVGDRRDVPVRCVADQDGPVWLVHDVLAVSASGADAGIYTPANILRVSGQLGLDVRALDACIDDPGVAAAVRAETAEGNAAGISGGPTVVVRRGDTEVGRFTGAGGRRDGARGDRRGEVAVGHRRGDAPRARPLLRGRRRR